MNACAWILPWAVLIPIAGEADEQDTPLFVAETLEAPPSTLAAMTVVVDAVATLKEPGVQPVIAALDATLSETDSRGVVVTIRLLARAETAQGAELWLDGLQQEFEAKLWRRFDGRPVDYDRIKSVFFRHEDLFCGHRDGVASGERTLELNLTAHSGRTLRTSHPDVDGYIHDLAERPGVGFGPIAVSKRVGTHHGDAYDKFNVSSADGREVYINTAANLLFMTEYRSSSTSLGLIQVRNALELQNPRLTLEFEVLAPAGARDSEPR